MKRPVRFRSIARREFAEAALWYERKAPGLGADFVQAVDSTLERIDQNPGQFREVRKGVRRAVLRRFPYTLHFRTSDDEILVLAVFHAKRNPTHLERRY
jgi:plasmid stabilization system protein ParE